MPTHAQTDSALGVAAKCVARMAGHVPFVRGRSFPVAACKLHNGNLLACFHLGESHEVLHVGHRERPTLPT